MGNNVGSMGPQSISPVTTVVIRNLPASVETQHEARAWLDAAGFANKYDFFLFFPSKRVRRPSDPPLSLAYAFVNFKEEKSARACIGELDGLSLNEDDPAVNVVGARRQGLVQLIQHFSQL